MSVKLRFTDSQGNVTEGEGEVVEVEVDEGDMFEGMYGGYGAYGE